MNLSNLKKAVALSVVSAITAGVAIAQPSDTTKMAGATSAKIFGGRGQYRTWNIGVNVGMTSNHAIIGGRNDFDQVGTSISSGLSVRKQLAHSFGIEADYLMGWVVGTSSTATAATDVKSFSTSFYNASINAVVNVATIDYLRRKNAINFFFTGGLGVMGYSPYLKTLNGATYNYVQGANVSHQMSEVFIPVGAGVKFRLTDALNLNVGYTVYLVDNDKFDGKVPTSGDFSHRDKFSNTYAGLEYSLGSKSKPNLDWVNPVAMMYDELNDPTLRQEVEALKGRVTNVEKAVNDLKKDSDGDGVSDQFDKCPGTPAGTVVDGAGCPIKFPVVDTAALKKAILGDVVIPTNTGKVQFEFDSAVIRTPYYATLDAVVADLKANPKKTVNVYGYASAEGTPAHNLQLSKDRAAAVKTYLVNAGIAAKRLKTKGFGENNPVADNTTDAGRVLNRRVEFK